MTLRGINRSVIDLVENLSGCAVVVSEDASLKTLAAFRTATVDRNYGRNSPSTWAR